MPSRLQHRHADHRVEEDRIATVRRFNRFYTRQIGVLRKTFLDSPYSLGEARVLYEIARGDAPTASAVGRALDLDAGYLSRVLRNFEKRGLIRREASSSDARQSHLTLTPRGRKDYAPLERRSQRDTGATRRPSQAGVSAPSDRGDGDDPDAARRRCRNDGAASASRGPRVNILRAPRPGDFGWVVKRHAELYAQEYRWIEPFEGVCAQIVADFANKKDPQARAPAGSRKWTARLSAASVPWLADFDKVARITCCGRPESARTGLGERLVDECIDFARGAGYKKITLWTHSVLTVVCNIIRSRIYAHA